MTTTPSSSPTDDSPSVIVPQDAAAETPARDADRGTRTGAAAVAVAVVVLAALMAGSWWNQHAELQALRTEVAQRLQSGEVAANGTQALLKSLQENQKDVQNRLSVLENKQVEAQSQQLALEQLYQDLSKNRDEWALSEIEQVLSTAAQQLQLAGNVQGAIIALQNADRNLSRSDKPQFITIRRAIADDLERLKAVSAPDITGMALRLDSAIGQIDAMPLLSNEKPVTPAAAPKRQARHGTAAPASAAKSAPKPGAAPAAADGPSGVRDWLAWLQDRWQSWIAELGNDFRQLISVRNVDTPEALLLSPSQAYYLRENLKLRLLSARLALLSRNESAFRSDLIAAQETISKYFDTRARQTQTVQALLRQVQNVNLSIELPTLTESLNAVRNYKAQP
ncbi:MAG: uroporphyrinogen-III C-methyltransferase [Burkholderiaceae bacterium]